MTRLLLVRHGEVESDKLGRYWGHTDIPLSAQGVRQAKMLRQRLVSENITAVYSSDLRRALDTAAAIAAPHRVPVVRCLELREICFGQCEGMTFNEIKSYHPEAETVWAGVDLGLRFPGGESLDDLLQRIDRFVERLWKDGPRDTALVVGHGGSLRMLVCRMTGLDPSHWWRIRIDKASLSVLESYPEGTVLSLLNDVCHLGVNREIDA